MTVSYKEMQKNKNLDDFIKEEDEEAEHMMSDEEGEAQAETESDEVDNSNDAAK